MLNKSGKISILLFSREYPPNIIGGTAMVAKLSAEGLQKLGYQVTVISSYVGDTIKVEDINGVKVIFVNDNSIYMDHTEFENQVFKHHMRIATLIMNKIDKKPDVIVLPDLFSFPEAKIASKKYNAPIINILLQDFSKMVIYDKCGVHRVTNHVNANESDLLKIEHKSLMQSDTNVFISNSLAESIIEHYQLDKKNCETIYLGVDKNEMKTKSEIDYFKIRNEVCPINKKMFCSIGRLVPIKGFNYLIRAFKIIHDYDRDTFLLIMGTGPEEEELNRIVANLNLTDCVRIQYVPERQKAVSYMKVCDYAVVPSLWESFCYVAAEFMSLGKPLIVSSVDSLNELMIDGKTGLICPIEEDGIKRSININVLAEQMKKLLDNKDLSYNFGQAAKKRAYSHFTEEIYAKNLSDLIMKIIIHRGNHEF